MKVAVVALRVVMVLLLAGMLGAQLVVLPLLGSAVVAEAPEVSSLRWWVLGGAVLVVAAAQVSVVCGWRLLTLAGQGALASGRARRVVTVVLTAVVTATVLVTAMNVLLTRSAVNPPLVALGLASGTVVGIALSLLLVVVRGRMAPTDARPPAAVAVA